MEDWRTFIGPTDSNRARSIAPERFEWDPFDEIKLIYVLMTLAREIYCCVSDMTLSASALYTAPTARAMQCTGAILWSAPSVKSASFSPTVCP